MSVHPGWPEDLGPLRVPAGVVTVRPSSFVTLRCGVDSAYAIVSTSSRGSPPESRPGMRVITSPSGRLCAEIFAPKRVRAGSCRWSSNWTGSTAGRSPSEMSCAALCGPPGWAIGSPRTSPAVALPQRPLRSRSITRSRRSVCIESRRQFARERVESRSPAQCGVPGGRSPQALSRCRRPMARPSSGRNDHRGSTHHRCRQIGAVRTRFVGVTKTAQVAWETRAKRQLPLSSPTFGRQIVIFDSTRT